MYRPVFRTQKPDADPTEPNGGESKAKGDAHGWNGCSATAAGRVLAQFTRGRKDLWGGAVRHRLRNPEGAREGPMLGLDDIGRAFRTMGYDLEAGRGGWKGVLRAHRAGRPIILQGKGDCPGKGTYKGPHAASWMPDGVWGDPLTNKWQRVERTAIKRWAQNYDSDISFAMPIKKP